MNSRVKKNSLLLIFYSFSGIAAQKKKKKKNSNVSPRETFLRATSSTSPYFPLLRLHHPRAQQVEIASREEGEARRGEARRI